MSEVTWQNMSDYFISVYRDGNIYRVFVGKTQDEAIDKLDKWTKANPDK